MIRPPPSSPLFPYPPLFRSLEDAARAPPAEHAADDLGVQRAATGGHPPDRVGERVHVADPLLEQVADPFGALDRKSTRLNSSHANISYAVFCLKKKHKTASQ